MNKTVTVNISGQIFNIDEQAFEKLRKYLDTIRKYLNDSEGADEVINDIESRIAELFLERTSDQKNVINQVDVDAIIGIMGKPEDYVAGEMEAEQEASEYRPKGKKRFFQRSRQQYHWRSQLWFVCLFRMGSNLVEAIIYSLILIRRIRTHYVYHFMDHYPKSGDNS